MTFPDAQRAPLIADEDVTLALARNLVTSRIADLPEKIRLHGLKE